MSQMKTAEPTTEELAVAHFEAQERVRMMGMMNSPTKYEDRKKAAVEYAVAVEAALHAQLKLDARLRGE